MGKSFFSGPLAYQSNLNQQYFCFPFFLSMSLHIFAHAAFISGNIFHFRSVKSLSYTKIVTNE